MTLWETSWWKLIALVVWFTVIFATTEIYLSVGDNRTRIYNEGDPLPYEKTKREEINDF